MENRPERVLITGASSGLGRALAEAYASREGAVVGAVARRADLLDDLAREHAAIQPLAADVTDAPAMETLIARFALEAGGLDLVIANAGVGQKSADDAWDPDTSRRIVEVNIRGVTNTIVPAIPIMIEQGRGRLVGISSLAGQTPLPASAAYGASKAWLVFYLESLALDLEPHGVNCTAVMPGHIPTPMVDGQGAPLVNPGARRAAERIVRGIDRGERIIRFPWKVATLTRLAAWAPRSFKANLQRRRLAKRKSRRGA
ncbi:MAG: SDR family NAD(P)-dependent oxidoreductase [Phycisphaerales bacterium]